jgi:hypothetical protein
MFRGMGKLSLLLECRSDEPIQRIHQIEEADSAFSDKSNAQELLALSIGLLLLFIQINYTGPCTDTIVEAAFSCLQGNKNENMSSEVNTCFITFNQ